jgi:hypothetical protein
MNHFGAQAQRVNVRSKFMERRSGSGFAFRPDAQQCDQCVETFSIG